MKIENAKLALIERTIVVGKTNKKMVLDGIREGCTKRTIKYVKKHDTLPSLEYLMSEYDNNYTFQQILKKADIERADVEKTVKGILGIPTDEILEMADEYNLTQATSDNIGRNDPCPCGSGKKYKKCCGK